MDKLVPFIKLGFHLFNMFLNMELFPNFTVGDCVSVGVIVALFLCFLFKGKGDGD